MKVRGFQGMHTATSCRLPFNTLPVAPAELEGHLLQHPDVGDACVVGVPDEYSGEIPLAFIVPSHEAQERLKKNPKEEENIKAAITKVGFELQRCLAHGF